MEIASKTKLERDSAPTLSKQSYAKQNETAARRLTRHFQRNYRAGDGCPCCARLGIVSPVVTGKVRQGFFFELGVIALKRKAPTKVTESWQAPGRTTT